MNDFMKANNQNNEKGGGGKTPPQVIHFSPDGTVSGLERKDGIDFKKLGKASVERASEILWDEDIQKWYVKFLIGERAGQLLSDCKGNTLYYDSYQSANIGEINALNHEIINT